MGVWIDALAVVGYTSGMGKRTVATAFLLAGVLAATVVGCGPSATAGPFRRLLGREKLPSPPPDAPRANRGTPPPTVPEDPPVVTAKAEEPVDLPPPRRPKSILALSGGGSYGAFTVGVLNGWTRTNQRPEFDVVTGVSTGALIAPLAFLGPKYDADLKQAYTEITRRDVIPVRNVVTIPFRDSLASSSGLRKLVEGKLTEDVIAAVAAEHRKGRRLYVATTNLDTRKQVVWDVGAIAAREGRDSRKLFIDVLVASAAVPALFPAVEIEVEVGGTRVIERHVDGGVTSPVFVPQTVFESADAGAKLYVILAGKMYAEPLQVRPRLVKVLTASGGALMASAARRCLANLYHVSRQHDVQFHSISLRQDFLIEESRIDFEPVAMSRLFVEGVQVGVAGPKWETQPPDFGPGEDGEIRTGSRLRVSP